MHQRKKGGKLQFEAEQLGGFKKSSKRKDSNHKGLGTLGRPTTEVVLSSKGRFKL